jgi:hypothetical protein
MAGVLNFRSKTSLHSAAEHHKKMKDITEPYQAIVNGPTFAAMNHGDQVHEPYVLNFLTHGHPTRFPNFLWDIKIVPKRITPAEMLQIYYICQPLASFVYPSKWPNRNKVSRANQLYRSRV